MSLATRDENGWTLQDVVSSEVFDSIAWAYISNQT